LEDVQEGESITLSYIPLSGLSVQERQARLLAGYGFQCNCNACSSSNSKHPQDVLLQLPTTDVDLDSIREIQYNCNERLLQLRLLVSKRETIRALPEEYDDEIENTISTIQMIRRGIQNQGIPSCHEVSIEVDRLLAMAFSLPRGSSRTTTTTATSLDAIAMAMKHHERFFAESSKLGFLFDPVAKATQHLEYSRVVSSTSTASAGTTSVDAVAAADAERQKGLQLLQIAIGKDHPWVQALLVSEETTTTHTTTTTCSSSSKPPAKRVKLSTSTTDEVAREKEQ
jgi:hypothetical protein